MSERTIEVGQRLLTVANLDKLVFPGEGITQGDLIDVFRCLSETLLPHLADRPLTMQRFPNGIQEEGFYQRKAQDYFPDWITRLSVEVRGDDGEHREVICKSEASLVYFVGQGMVTPHVWLSRADRLCRPDKMVFDLDPPDGDFEPVRLAAERLRDVLADLGLVSFVMTTGSRGAHVVVPLDRSADVEAVRGFAKDLAGLLAQREPDRLTVEMRKVDRGDRLFLDYLRNAYGQNSVAPYAVRAISGAPVATPLDWDELPDPDLNAQTYTVRNIFRRLGQKDDPWKGYMRHARSLNDSRIRLDKMLEAA